MFVVGCALGASALGDDGPGTTTDTVPTTTTATSTTTATTTTTATAPALLRSCPVPVYVWTVDDPALARRLEALGVAAIITNDPRIFAF